MLRTIPLDSLTIRQYDYMRTKEQQCLQWQTQKNDDDGESAWGIVGIVFVVLLAIGLVGNLAS